MKNGLLKFAMPGSSRARLAGQIAGLLEDEGLRLGRGQELDQLVRPSGGASTAWGCRGTTRPSCRRRPGPRRCPSRPSVLRSLPLDVAHGPPGQVTVAKSPSLTPVFHASRTRRGRRSGPWRYRSIVSVPRRLHRGIVGDDHVALGVVVRGVDLADHRVVHVAARVEELRPLRCVRLVLLAGLDEGLLSRPQLRHGVTPATGRPASWTRSRRKQIAMLPTSVPSPVCAPLDAIDCCPLPGSHWLFSSAPYEFRSTNFWGSALTCAM